MFFQHRKPSKIELGEVLGAVFGEFWGILGSLGASWARLGVHWVRLGASEDVFEASWGHLWASWEDLGKVLGSLGGFLRPFWKHF